MICHSYQHAVVVWTRYYGSYLHTYLVVKFQYVNPAANVSRIDPENQINNVAEGVLEMF